MFNVKNFGFKNWRLGRLVKMKTKNKAKNQSQSIGSRSIRKLYVHFWKGKYYVPNKSVKIVSPLNNKCIFRKFNGKNTTLIDKKCSKICTFSHRWMVL